jgi:hypothetical protein
VNKITNVGRSSALTLREAKPWQSSSTLTLCKLGEDADNIAEDYVRAQSGANGPSRQWADPVPPGKPVLNGGSAICGAILSHHRIHHGYLHLHTSSSRGPIERSCHVMPASRFARNVTTKKTRAMRWPMRNKKKTLVTTKRTQAMRCRIGIKPLHTSPSSSMSPFMGTAHQRLLRCLIAPPAA